MKRKLLIASAAVVPLSVLIGAVILARPVFAPSEETRTAMATMPAETAEAPVTDDITTPAPTAAPTAASEPETTAPLVETTPPEGAVLTAKPVEVYTALTLGQLLEDTNVQLANGDTTLDTSLTGTFEVTVSYTYEGKSYAHPLSYTVEDTTAPLLLNAGWGAVVEQGETFALTQHVGYADNYDPVPILTYTGTVDTNVCGVYPLTATVTDASGNATSWELSIEVVEEEITPPDNASRLSFDSFTQQYAGENVRFGIDVSKWQGDIDFEAVKAAGCSFVIMRMGHYYDEIVMDEYYLANMEKARAAGLEVGVYLYTTANTEEEVRENARWIAEQLDGQPLDFPVVFDWESFSRFQQYAMSIHDLNCLFEIFAEEMEQYGYSAMLYGSKNYLNNFWYDHDDHPVWLAHYTDRTDYAGDYVMWQMSSRGRIDGITGDVDLNILYTDPEMD